ncbi:Uncharacterised protein [Serratia fonticola]|uniref:Uncharacterized protein n=1 Tax=Serratia fonticola TaxID=47917 RepID=A0A4U9WM99_SERFO|nr:Uncharacterised protein [Serratia fonticola]
MSLSHNTQGHISITGVSKVFGRHRALDNVSLEISTRLGNGDPRAVRIRKVDAVTHH